MENYKKMTDDIVFPFSPNRAEWSKAQRWYTANNLSPTSFPMSDWTICGKVYIFDTDSVVELDGHLRFGDHDSMEGFRLCLYVPFEDDDKYEFEAVRASGVGQTIVGSAASRTVVLQVYPFQVQKLHLLAARHNIPGLLVLIGEQMDINHTMVI